MGLTADAMGIKAVDNGLIIHRKSKNDQVIALAGNPNVGKSTVFNYLTGMNQHTGNWPGKTVSNAQGNYTFQDKDYVLVDIPGTYSLMAHSTEEEVARDFICFGDADAVVVVCDATCLERNLNLVLQTIEITHNVVVCVNLMDEAKKKKITIDFKQLEINLGVPVIGTNATSGGGLDTLMEKISTVKQQAVDKEVTLIQYTTQIEEAIHMVQPIIEEKVGCQLNARWISLKLLDSDEILMESLSQYLGYNILNDPHVSDVIHQAKDYLQACGLSQNQLKDTIVSCIVHRAEDICSNSILFEKCDYHAMDRKIDKILTSKWTGIPVMLLLLAIIFWLTITGSNYPTELLSNVFNWIQDQLLLFLNDLGTPKCVSSMLILGVYRVVAWVVAVMLPPMAIFFPLFTLLEDLGYLPRVAFNLDSQFKKCHACGKQALTMCMVDNMLSLC